MIKNRPLSFLIMFLVYAIATCFSAVIYPLFNMDYWLVLLIIDVLATVLVFIFSVIFRNASVYDPYWSVQPIIILIFAAVINGVNTMDILLLCAVSFWGLRLTANWAYTFTDLTHQDWRYTMLKEKTKIFYPLINFIGIHMVPTLVVYLCILPAVAVSHYKPVFNPVSIIFVICSFAAATIQGIADIQMHKFRKNRNGPFNRIGLWKKGRHPNYFGEILMWWGIGLACVVTMPDRWYLIAGAIANTILFFSVSIPMADNRQSRKPGFAEYKKETRILL